MNCVPVPQSRHAESKIADVPDGTLRSRCKVGAHRLVQIAIANFRRGYNSCELPPIAMLPIDLTARLVQRRTSSMPVVNLIDFAHDVFVNRKSEPDFRAPGSDGPHPSRDVVKFEGRHVRPVQQGELDQNAGFVDGNRFFSFLHCF